MALSHTGVAVAQPAAEQFSALIRESFTALAVGNVAALRKSCTAAAELAGRSADPEQQAKAELCLAKLAEFDANAPIACRRYEAAAQMLVRLHADPARDSMESLHEFVRMAHGTLRCPGQIAALPVQSGSAPLARDYKELAQRVLIVPWLIGQGRIGDAGERCQSAQNYSARFAADAFMNGLVDICFGQLARAQTQRVAACSRFAAAQERLDAVKPEHRAFDEARFLRGEVAHWRKELGC